MLFIIFVIFISGILINYFVIKNYKNLNLSILLDKEYFKPQSFHKRPVLCFGGSSIYILFLIIFLFFNLKFFNHFFLFSTVAFFIGLVDDLKIKLRPLFRLMLIFVFFFTIIKFLNININDFNIDFLNKILKKYYYLELIFITFCFVFIINGSNFIDGFNGLLTLHVLIILLILNFINYYFLNYDLLIFGVIIFFAILSFAFFNFPKARLFLGDGGSYLMGALISYLVIQTSNYNSNIPSFFFCCLLYYLFFEVFFSFVRKFFYENNNPLAPDKNHLHMLFFSKIIRKKKLSNANFITGFYINVIYVLTLIPIFYFYNNNLFLKYYFFILITIYSLCYYKLRKYK
jgi:UDP-N-acetylmuramyl pentapeptide phosphotransferase/UDP-N-acetylglucosamine-1-phosphate transferase